MSLVKVELMAELLYWIDCTGVPNEVAGEGTCASTFILKGILGGISALFNSDSRERKDRGERGDDMQPSAPSKSNPSCCG